MGISRRNFLKTLAATSVVASVNPLMAAKETKFYDIKKVPHATHFGA
ncbi:twin-arginine translocation signal domain-containing protein, partial [Campylobacter jejuni]|nr:twin-arginine translocation signal domain-containing protein [Campylobacter jejuni]